MTIIPMNTSKSKLKILQTKSYLFTLIFHSKLKFFSYFDRDNVLNHSKLVQYSVNQTFETLDPYPFGVDPVSNNIFLHCVSEDVDLIWGRGTHILILKVIDFSALHRWGCWSYKCICGRGDSYTAPVSWYCLCILHVWIDHTSWCWRG